MPVAEQDVGRAFELGEFVPYFQPLVDLRGGKIHGFEILARWEHPAGGLVPPGDFVPVIERDGLANKLSASLLTQAFTAVRDLPTSFGLSVNLAPSQLHDRSLPDLIHRLADKAEFDLARLTIELTETALVDDLELAGAVATGFKKLGIRLALDDFGTGYSSLLHLQSLPFDELKLDLSFVRSMVESRQSRKITAAVIGLGLSLGLQTVAEGVEGQSQANLLAWQGCNLGQGYLYGPAVPAQELSTALARRYPGVSSSSEVPATIADPFLSLDAQPAEQLSQLRAIYDGAPVGLAFLDRDLRHVNLNQRLAELNHVTIEAALGRKVSEVVPPALFAQIEPYLKRALGGEAFPGIEIRRPSTRPGEPATARMVSYQPVRDEAGEILGVSVSVADITDVKQNEEALRESEDHYRHAVELSPQIPWVMGANGTPISVSSRWEALTGMSREQLNEFGWIEVLHGDDRSRVVESVRRSLSTGEPIDVEFRVLCKGKWIWMRSRGAPRRSDAGEIIRWYGSMESIDDYKRALDELRSSEARLRAVFNAAPVGLVLVDSSTGEVLNANPRAEQLIGFRFEPGMIWTPKGWEAMDSVGNVIEGPNLPLTRALRSGETTDSQDLLLRRPDGSRIWLNVCATPIRLENGDQLGGVLVVQEMDWDERGNERLLKVARELMFAFSPAARTPQKQLSRLEAVAIRTDDEQDRDFRRLSKQQ